MTTETIDNSTPIKGMKTQVWGCPLMTGAFLGLVSFAITQNAFIDAFLKERPDFKSILRRSPFERMVDKATGFEEDKKSEMMAAFADYVNVNLWGDGESDDSIGSNEIL